MSPEILARSAYSPSEGDCVDLDLSYTPSARLKLTDPQIDTLVDLLHEYVSRAETDDGFELQADRPVPPLIFQAFARAKPDLQWQRRVSDWFFAGTAYRTDRIAVSLGERDGSEANLHYTSMGL